MITCHTTPQKSSRALNPVLQARVDPQGGHKAAEREVAEPHCLRGCWSLSTASKYERKRSATNNPVRISPSRGMNDPPSTLRTSDVE
jgi:hypothetical protein